ncbi:MAG: (E)-4-hydroxy-3-methylbut-2-enyl-diphosphate synthase [Treponema sp.]|jgi:(E)-4-hydroxy-3-methylbut-2-enyl-diphosphate synthase|nr:(E)-4-hydroxy-3-methylbut-2-enyl-diphosphate synthase [Treponema sp.]
MRNNQSRGIRIGGFGHVKAVDIGGSSHVAIQTMWKDRLGFDGLEGNAGEENTARIERLGAMGCSLLRFAVPDLEAAEVLGRLAGMVSMPLVADIHFDYRIALRCMDFPVAKVRINPGNIGSRDKVERVLVKAASRNIPIRIGINAGSLPVDIRNAVDSGGLSRAEALVRAAERELELFSEFNFQNILVSMKASSIADTVNANRLFFQRNDCPLHIGLTEAGPLIAGVSRSTAALLPLLCDGIGDTIRVSLSDTMEREVIAAREILSAAEETAGEGVMPCKPEAAGIRGGGRRLSGKKGVSIISCPRCGRNSFDTHGFTEKWQSALYALDKDITVAVMGCAVNGPGEARHADLGITGAGDKVLLFRKGVLLRTIAASGADEAFGEELEKL